MDGGPKNSEVAKFSAGNYVLLTYPNRPPNKLAGMYRGPMIISSIDRPYLVTVRELLRKTSAARSSMVTYGGKHQWSWCLEDHQEML